MSAAWLAGLVRRRGGRLAMTAVGIALAVALIASLGAFLSTSKATMTARATRSVAVDWQVQVQGGADPAAVLNTVRATAGVADALPVQFTPAAAFQATIAGSTQQTGAGVLVGLPDGYRAAFPDQIRQLTGATTGVLVAQQTAANLHVAPGDTVQVSLPGAPPQPLTVSGVVDLPQANSLFQTVGAPPQSQPTAPPDNVILLPQSTLTRVLAGPTGPTGSTGPNRAVVTTQIHLHRTALLDGDPAAAYTQVTGAARNLEARLAGTGRVGDNLGAALDAARKDASYAQILFLFLGAPGAVLAALVTAAVAGAGADRRRTEQSLLRTRGLRPARIIALAAVEATAVGLAGGLAGLALAVAVGRLAFGAAFAASARTDTIWFVLAMALGLAIAAGTILIPAIRALRSATVVSTRRTGRLSATPWWARFGLDGVLLAASGAVFWASGSDNYSLVLAPEGVPTISVSYWAFLGPALLWLGSALLLWRLTALVLTHGRGALTRLARPLTGRLAGTTAASMTRRSRPLARAVVLLALAVSFAASTATFNATYRQQAEVDALLTNGADVTVTEPPTATAGADLTRTLAAVPGVRHVEPVQHRFAYVGADLQDLYGVRPASITDATALQDTYFVGGTARQLMATLAARPDSLLVSDETVKDFQLHTGDLINLRLQNAATQTYTMVPFHYVGIVKEFPTAPKDSFFVANAAYIAKATGSPAVGTFLLDTGGTDQSQIAEQVRRQLGTTATVTDITQSRTAVGSSLTSVDLAGLTRIELAFAVVLAAAAAGIVLALGLAERRRTFAITTVLGATTRQLRGLVLSEAAAVTGLGLLGGAVIAWGLSRMLVAVLTGVFDPPPSSIAVPWPYLASTLAAILAAVAAAALTGARRTTRPAVEELRTIPSTPPAPASPATLSTVKAVRGEPAQAAVLLVEDDETIGRNLLAGLRAHGYTTTWCRTGTAALLEARQRAYDLVLLDLGLPDVDGTDVARDLRHHHHDLLIIMLTARSDDIDVVVGLDVGADDYLVKPVPLSVLLARIRAHLRRRPAPTTSPRHTLTVGDLHVDVAARTCHLGTTPITLRPKEFDLLAELAAQPGVALRREDLMATVWDENWFGSTKTLDVTMAALRRQLQDAERDGATRAPTITTLRGHGYRLEPPPQDNPRTDAR